MIERPLEKLFVGQYRKRRGSGGFVAFRNRRRVEILGDHTCRRRRFLDFRNYRRAARFESCAEAAPFRARALLQFLNGNKGALSQQLRTLANEDLLKHSELGRTRTVGHENRRSRTLSGGDNFILSALKTRRQSDAAGRRDPIPPRVRHREPSNVGPSSKQLPQPITPGIAPHQRAVHVLEPPAVRATCAVAA